MPVIGLMLRVMCAWSENPALSAISARGISVFCIAFQARRVRERTRKASGEVPKTCANPRVTVHDANRRSCAQLERTSDESSIKAAANSSGQSIQCGVAYWIVESSRAAASAGLFSAASTMRSGSASLAAPGLNAHPIVNGRLRISAPALPNRPRCASKPSWISMLPGSTRNLPWSPASSKPPATTTTASAPILRPQRLAASFSSARNPLGVPGGELLQHGPPRLHANPLQVFMDQFYSLLERPGRMWARNAPNTLRSLARPVLKIPG